MIVVTSFVFWHASLSSIILSLIRLISSISFGSFVSLDYPYTISIALRDKKKFAAMAHIPRFRSFPIYLLYTPAGTNYNNTNEADSDRWENACRNSCDIET